eukprot:scaffold70819_cov21-Prasinocladus_malaysianus.AAC.1
MQPSATSECTSTDALLLYLDNGCQVGVGNEQNIVITIDGVTEPPQLSTIAEAVLMLLNSRTPSNHWFLYPGWNPGTLVFVLERLFGLYGDDLEVNATFNNNFYLSAGLDKVGQKWTDLDRFWTG